MWWIDFWNKRPLLNIGVAIIYYLLVVLPHEEVGLWTVEVFKDFTRDQYNLLILVVGLCILLLYTFPFIRGTYRREDTSFSKRLIFYLLSTIILSVISFRLLVVVNIEIVHFFQYGMMALLLFPLCRTYSLSLLWVTLLGAADEAYQYFYLAPERTNYFDFNDVLINLLGGVFGLLLLKNKHLFYPKDQQYKWVKRFSYYFLGILTLTFIALYMGGYLYIYPPIEPKEAFILLNKEGHPGQFWSEVPPKVIYHIIQPLEGFILTSLLLLFYKGLDLFR